MNISTDTLRNLAGLCTSGAIHFACNAADTASFGITQTLGFTPLLKTFGQSIAANLGANHIQEMFSLGRVRQLLKDKHPEKLNHDLEKMFKEAGVTAIKYLIAILKADWKNGELPDLTKKELNAIVNFLQDCERDLRRELERKDSDFNKIETTDIEDPKDFLSRLSDFIFDSTALQSKSEESAERLKEFYTPYLPWCFNLAFHEALKDDKNARGFKALQIGYMEESKILLRENNKLLKEIDEKLKRLDKGENLINKETLEQWFKDSLKDALALFNERLDNIEKVLQEVLPQLLGYLERIDKRTERIEEDVKEVKKTGEDTNIHVVEIKRDTQEIKRILTEMQQKEATNSTEEMRITIKKLKSQLLEKEEIIKQQEKDKADLIQSLSDDKNELKTKALKEVAQGNYDEAKDLLKQTLTDNATTYYELGKIEKLQLNYSEALRYFELAININSTHKDYLWETAKMYQIAGFYDKAITLLGTLIGNTKEEDNELGTYYNNLGLAYDAKGEYDLAIEYYEKALAIDKKFYHEEHPRIAIRYNNLGGSYYAKGEYDLAIKYLEKALAIFNKFYHEEHPNIVTVKNSIAYCIIASEKK